ncbi:MAG: serine/threonine protein kinase [Anaerolineaceae bacterium]|nr:serine/threonine protein kinase [Anaerolineaceae bacterium]
MSPQHLTPGTVLNQNYLIGKALGQGGFGITYIGWDLNAWRIVAVKEYYPSGLVTRERGLFVAPIDDDAKVKMKKGVNLFFKEALILGNFSSHPNIVNVLHFFRQNNTAYIVMEYINGKSLKDYLQARGGSISFTEAMQILCPIMLALDDLHHTGLLHRDISPDNIYLTVDGHAKLLDFGAARFSIGEETQNAASIIKPGYAPLEQYPGSGTEQGSWTDVYAMGATFYRSLTGNLPTAAPDRAMGREMPSPRELGINIPEGADKAIMHALSMKPEDRYVSIRSFEEDIEHAAADLKKSFDFTPPQVQMAPQYIAQSWMVPGVQMSPQVPVPNYPVGMQSQIPQQVSFQRPVLPSYPPMQYIPSPGMQDSQMLTIQTTEPGFFEWTFRHFKKKLRKAFRKMRKRSGKL